MGKAKGAPGAEGSDYSGRPLGRPTPEGIAAGTAVPISPIATTLPDGRRAIRSSGGRWYLPDENDRPDHDRPVSPETGEPA